jgi:hypothetical protein
MHLLFNNSAAKGRQDGRMVTIEPVPEFELVAAELDELDEKLH